MNFDKESTSRKNVGDNGRVGWGCRWGRAPKEGRGKLIRNFDKVSKSRIIYLRVGEGTVGAGGRGPNYD